MKTLIPILSLLSILAFTTHVVGQDPLDSLRKYLVEHSAAEVVTSELAEMKLNKEQAKSAKEMLWNAHSKQLKSERAEEWKNKVIHQGDRQMKFDFRIFGDKPESGRSLFISMHGGGGAPARVNDQQWQNQIGLYKPKEGVYLAPRAPTNTWNLWHEGHIDPMFTRLIEDATLFEDVDPNRVFLMGYSAGGDGVYQLAPRMADQLAAAAMMAGHPNDAQPFGLRNIGFTLHMGGKDAAYKRNEIARQWKKRLAELKESDPDGFEHEVVIHEQHGHWMQRDDAVAVEWMSKFVRAPFPKKVVWYQSPVTHDRFYWLAVDEENKRARSHVIVTRDGQKFEIEKAEGIDALVLRFNDQMIDFDQPVVVRYGDNEVFRGKIERKLSTLSKTLTERSDPTSTYSAELQVEIPRSEN